MTDRTRVKASRRANVRRLQRERRLGHVLKWRTPKIEWCRFCCAVLRRGAAACPFCGDMTGNPEGPAERDLREAFAKRAPETEKPDEI